MVDADLRISFESAEFRPDGLGKLADFDEARFGDLNFRRLANFDEARFIRETPTGERPDAVSASFREIKCNGTLSMRRVQFANIVSVDFASGRFEDDVDLSGAHLGKDVIFEKCQFRQSLSVAGTSFVGYPDFRNASFKHYPNLFEASLPDRLVSYDRRLRPQIASRIATLRRIAQRANDDKTDVTLLVHELKLKGGIVSNLYGLVSNYGQSWLRPAFWLVILAIGAFPALQLFVNGRLPASLDEWQAAALGEAPTCASGQVA